MSLWALPAAQDAARFTPIINRLALATGTAPFASHITLSDVAPTTPFDVTLTHITHSDARFRCIVLEAERDAHFAALRVAAPHLSLVYAELDAETRAALFATVDLRLPMTITIDAIAEVDTSGDVPEWSQLARMPLR